MADVSYRDFRRGKAATLVLLQDAQFAVLSANLLDADTGQPLVQPYVIKQVAHQRIVLDWAHPVPCRPSVPAASQGAADRHSHPARPLRP